MPTVFVPEEIRKGLPDIACSLVEGAVQKFEQNPNLPGFRLKYVQKSDNKLICIRADKKARLVLGIIKAASDKEASSSSSGFLTTLGDDAVCALLEVILDHNYDKAKFGQPAHVAKLMAGFEAYRLEYEKRLVKPVLPEENSVPEYQKLRFGHRSYVLDEKQADALHSMHFPALLTGSAGTGKSLLAIAQIQQYLERAENGARALYLVPSDYLKHKIARDIHQACGDAIANRVDVLQPEEFLLRAGFVSAQDAFNTSNSFYTWLAQYKKHPLRQYTAERVYLECSSRASFESEEAYCSSGEKHSTLNLEEKKHLCALYNSYLAELHGQKKIDIGLNLSGPNTSNPALCYSIVVVDEAQCLGAGTISAFCKMFYAGHGLPEWLPASLLFIADVNQVSVTGARTVEQVLKSCFAERLASYHLDTTHRCPKAVVEVAQKCLNMAHRIRGELEKGASRATLKALASEVPQDVVHIANLDNQTELKKIDEVAQSHNTCLITSKDVHSLPQPLQQIALVLKPGVVVGLEMADVIICEPFEREDMLGLLRLLENSDEAKKNPAGYVDILRKLLHLYTSLTRKTQETGHVFVLSRFIGEPKYKDVWQALFPGLVESPKKANKKSPVPSPDKKSPISPDKKQSSEEQWLSTAKEFALRNDKDNLDRIFNLHLKSKLSYADYCRRIGFQPVQNTARKLDFFAPTTPRPASSSRVSKKVVQNAPQKTSVAQKKFVPGLDALNLNASENQGYILLEKTSDMEALLKYVHKHEKDVVAYLNKKFASDPQFTFHWFLSQQALTVLKKLSPKSLTDILNKNFTKTKLFAPNYPEPNAYNIFQLLLITSEGRSIISSRMSFFMENGIDVVRSLLQEFDAETVLGYTTLPKDSMFASRLSFLEYLLGEECIIGPVGHRPRQAQRSSLMLPPERPQPPKTAFGFFFEYPQPDRQFLLEFFKKIIDSVKLFRAEKRTWRVQLLNHIFGKGEPTQADRGVLWRLYRSEFGLELLVNHLMKYFEDYLEYMDFSSLFEPQESRIAVLNGAPLVASILMRCRKENKDCPHTNMLKKLFKEHRSMFRSSNLIRSYPNVSYLEHGLAGFMLSGLSDYNLCFDLFSEMGHDAVKALLGLCPRDFLVQPNEIARQIGRKKIVETIPLKRLALDNKDGHALLLYLYTAYPDAFIYTAPVHWFDLPGLTTNKPYEMAQMVRVFSLLLHSSQGLQVLLGYCRYVQDFSLLHSGLLSETLMLMKDGEPILPLGWIKEVDGKALLKLLLGKKPEFIKDLDLNDCQFDSICHLFTLLFKKEWFVYLAAMLESQPEDSVATLYHHNAKQFESCRFLELFGVALSPECDWLVKRILDADGSAKIFLEGLRRLAPLAALEFEQFMVEALGQNHREPCIAITGEDEDGLVLSKFGMFARDPGTQVEEGGELITKANPTPT